MPRPDAEGEASAGGAGLSILDALLAGDLERQHDSVLAANKAITAERARLITAAQDGILTDQDCVRYAELEHLSRAGIFRVRVYSALLGLARLGAQL